MSLKIDDEAYGIVKDLSDTTEVDFDIEQLAALRTIVEIFLSYDVKSKTVSAAVQEIFRIARDTHADKHN